MCTIIAKKFPNVGWVAVKNRDRSAPTRTKLLRDQEERYQRVTLVDEDTQWTEGMNSNGVSILSSSLTPVINGDRDRNTKQHSSRNGVILRDALAQPSLDTAIAVIRDRQVSGCVMIFDSDRMVLVEGKGGDTRQQIIKEITSDSVARTNHGIWLPNAGYQLNSDNTVSEMHRLSSEARLKTAQHILEISNTPYQLMPLLAKQWSDNPQLNTLRMPTDFIDTRTTEQLMIIPSKKLILLRNVNGKLDFNQADANPPGSEVMVGIL